MNITALKDRFEQYWEAEDRLAASAPLIHQDPTVFFVNAGVTPFKPVMLAGGDLETTGVIQQCFRAHLAEELQLFDMITVVGEAPDLPRVAARIMRFVEEVAGLPALRLFCVAHPSDKDLLSFVQPPIAGERVAYLEANRSDYWVRWSFGEETELVGRGITVTQYIGEGATRGPLDDPEHFVPLGNLIELTNTRLGCRYFDVGFGVEMLAAALNGGDVFTVEPFCSAVQTLEASGISPDRARVLLSSLSAATALYSGGLRPSTRGRGYVLRKLLRRCFRALVGTPMSATWALEILTNEGVIQVGSDEFVDFRSLLSQGERSFVEQHETNWRNARRYVKKRRWKSRAEAVSRLQSTFGLSDREAKRLVIEVLPPPL